MYTKLSEAAEHKSPSRGSSLLNTHGAEQKPPQTRVSRSSYKHHDPELGGTDTQRDSKLSDISVDDFDSEKVRAWNFRNTLAFWASIFFIEGAVLFTIGSVCIYPVVGLRGASYEAMVDYCFMIGAWCFLIGNYAVYFQVINQNVVHKVDRQEAKTTATQSATRSQSVRMLAPIDWNDGGHVGAVFNCVGAILFCFNTMSMYANKERTANFNLWYVMTGTFGSICFAVSAVAEGEHNNWRELRVSEMPVLMSFLNFFGGVLFMVAYVTDFNRFADNKCADGKCAFTVWLVATPFAVGSFLFILSSWISLWMWKQQRFGVGFAKTLDTDSEPIAVAVDWKQQLAVAIYIANICMAYCRLGFFATEDWGDWETVRILDVIQNLLVYHTIFFLMSVVHTTPDRHPYDYLLWCMRIIALFSFAKDTYGLHIMALRE
jgi:hypothetical protein